MKQLLFCCLAAISLAACKKNDTGNGGATNDPYYYPPNEATNAGVWETKSAASLGWDETQLQAAFDYAATKSTFGLIVLHHGKIVKEQYWNGWTKDNRYPLNSAGKSIVATIACIAQQDGILNINNKTSTYLGNGWTSLPLAKENLITVKHQLTMTTGLEDAVPDDNCTTPSCLTYKADAGTRWAYHNAPYRLLQDVLGVASGKSFPLYAKEKLNDKIGMNTNHFWLNNIFYCTTRDAARFGSLILRKGDWNGTALITDQNYFTAMTNTSQNLNLSYGYLWWLNGKASSMAPTLQTVFPVSLAPNAPADMIMALGKDDKKVYVVPSLDVVVVRLGDNAGASLLGPSSFDNDLWTKFKPAMKF
jgi:CubicO group peptidase (beta-lactamase class C family)